MFIGMFNLRSKERMNYTPGEAENALFDAIDAGDEALARGIIQSGINPHARNEFSRTPLHMAASIGLAGVIPDLVAAGAQLQPEGAAGETPLTMAVVHEHPGCVRALLAAGADIDHKDEENGWTPLFWATLMSSPRPGMAALLLDNGADPFIADNKGKKPADLAAQNVTHDALRSPTLEDADKFVKVAALLRAHIKGGEQAQRTKALRARTNRRRGYMPKP